jgi:hypothetical protein
VKGGFQVPEVYKLTDKPMDESKWELVTLHPPCSFQHAGALMGGCRISGLWRKRKAVETTGAKSAPQMEG